MKIRINTISVNKNKKLKLEFKSRKVELNKKWTIIFIIYLTLMISIALAGIIMVFIIHKHVQ
ncbi:hypothetical protein ASO20_00130 [Mycoplasma sp. (ex Biomphalaria glabrata)]|uniref:hypothetical protein n=1 Tax=Mycoplasma sp. (ex Biomphalaria glabrata) TaxID=1749074 RepID=UPI00073A9E71|nr:hypothetical protein [Mycoplasma sp. (ex Biomphalaria glabrata)]ALV23088.1 hypothetical protein ASO20_00130 [Mycoplasma sp. (ex Biomphalaria glabrata)]